MPSLRGTAVIPPLRGDVTSVELAAEKKTESSLVYDGTSVEVMARLFCLKVRLVKSVLSQKVDAFGWLLDG